MELSPPTVGALTGVAVVLFIAIVARRSEKRALDQRLQIVQDKIRRRQEQLEADERAAAEESGADGDDAPARSD